MAINYFAPRSNVLAFPTPQWVKGPRVRIDSLPVGAWFEDTTGMLGRVTGRDGELVTTSNSKFGYGSSAEVLVVDSYESAAEVLVVDGEVSDG